MSRREAALSDVHLEARRAAEDAVRAIWPTVLSDELACGSANDAVTAAFAVLREAGHRVWQCVHGHGFRPTQCPCPDPLPGSGWGYWVPADALAGEDET